MRTELLFPIIRILLYLVHGVGMGFKVVACQHVLAEQYTCPVAWRRLLQIYR